MVENDRLCVWKGGDEGHGKYILYWMQSSQRVLHNQALEHAVERANEHGVPVVVFFCVDTKYPFASYRHYQFLIEGLQDVSKGLMDLGIHFVVREGNPAGTIVDLVDEALMVVTDRGYTRTTEEWRSQVSDAIGCPMVSVESNSVVPVGAASKKEEYSAATIRPKIKALSMRYLVPPDGSTPKLGSLDMSFDSLPIGDVDACLTALGIKDDRDYVKQFRGGTTEGLRLLDHFVKYKLKGYGACKNDPTKDCLSNLSPYLHFGQLSPITVANKVLWGRSGTQEEFLDELIVRRELAMNFVRYNKDYDNYTSLPDWAKRTLQNHLGDAREYEYSYDELERARTHDPYWNAAQTEMLRTGKMHGYMRMYWGKKVIEWSHDPGTAYDALIRLNDTYELDGRDHNGYAGVAWCFGKHDRPWKERAIFGTIRYMNSKGLKRKFDVDKYVDLVDNKSN